MSVTWEVKGDGGSRDRQIPGTCWAVRLHRSWMAGLVRDCLRRYGGKWLRKTPNVSFSLSQTAVPVHTLSIPPAKSLSLSLSDRGREQRQIIILERTNGNMEHWNVGYTERVLRWKYKALDLLNYQLTKTIYYSLLIKLIKIIKELFCIFALSNKLNAK